MANLLNKATVLVRQAAREGEIPETKERLFKPVGQSKGGLGRALGKRENPLLEISPGTFRAT